MNRHQHNPSLEQQPKSVHVHRHLLQGKLVIDALHERLTGCAVPELCEEANDVCSVTRFYSACDSGQGERLAHPHS